MPGPQLPGRARVEIVGGIASVKRNRRTGGWLQEPGEVRGKELRSIGLIDRPPRKLSEGIMQRNIERGVANQRRQARHGTKQLWGRGGAMSALISSLSAVELIPNRRQDFLIEAIAEFQSMGRRRNCHPRRSEPDAELFQGSVALFEIG